MGYEGFIGSLARVSCFIEEDSLLSRKNKRGQFVGLGYFPVSV